MVEAPTAAPRHRPLVLTDEQRAYGEAVGAFLSEHAPPQVVREQMETPSGYDRELWRRACGSVGVASVAVPTELGGDGGSLADLLVLAEELGRAVSSLPALSTVLTTTLLGRLVDADLGRDLLAPVLDGSRTAALALPADGQGKAVTASLVGGGWWLDGTALRVVDGDAADVVVVPARNEDRSLLLLVDRAAPGLSSTPLQTFDLTRKLADVQLVSAPAVLLQDSGVDAAVRHAVDVARAYLAAEQLGGASLCLDTAVRHARTRFQFGRPIGSFQAVQHRCADVLVAVERARTAVRFVGCSDGTPELRLAVAMAKATASEAYQLAAESLVQVLGGVGFTWDHEAHLHLKRARSSGRLLGDPSACRRDIAKALGL